MSSLSIHRLIVISNLTKLNQSSLSNKKFSTNNNSTITNENNTDSSVHLSQSIQDDSYQFNEQLIKRIKQNQLFNSKFTKQVNNENSFKLTPEVLKYVPSVSKIISETMTAENIKVLDIWKAKMIKKLGLSGFQKYQNDLFSRGKRLHKNIEYKLTEKEENIKIDEDINGFWSSLQPILNEIKEVHLIEQKLTHPNLLYKGVVDCVAKFNKVNTLVDWKTSEKVKDTLAKLYDAPVQTAAYLGALNQSNLLEFEIDKLAVVVSYNDGRIANYHQLKEKDCLNFWLIWTSKVEQYWINKLSSSPADPCLINYFDDLLLVNGDKSKKIYHLPNVDKKPSNEQPKKQKFKTKDELINLIKNKSK